MKRNRILIPLGALAAVLALGAVVMLVRASAEDLLHLAARRMYDAQTMYAVVEFQVDAPEKDTGGTVEVWRQRDAGPDGESAFYLEVLESSKEENEGVIAVSDGAEVWIWKPDKNTVYVGTREELREKRASLKEEFDHSGSEDPEFDEEEVLETPEEVVDKVLEYFTAERDGGEDLAGVATNKVLLVPIPEAVSEEVRANGGLVTVLLRDSDNAPLFAEYTGGAVGYARVEAKKLDLEVDIPAGKFTFEIPQGAEVVHLIDLEPPALSAEEAAELAEFPVLSPAQLPSGARLEGITEVRGAIVQRYRLPDGERFTIAQGPADAAGAPGEDGEPVTVRGVEGLLFRDEDGQRTLLTWQEAGVTFWVGGYLAVDDALGVAESLE